MSKSPAAIPFNTSGDELATADHPLRTDPTGTTTQPVSGTVTANAGTGPFPVSDNGGSLTVDGPLTDTELRATAVPISATSLPLPNGAATEISAAATKANTDNLDVLLSTRATEATLLAADGRLTTIDSVLDAIKDTDGIKKITDQLPAGTNEIGKVAQGTKAAGSGAWPQVLYDASGNAVGVILDGSLYRIQADAKIAKRVTDGGLAHLEALDTTAGVGRLKATLYTQDGDPVAFGSAPATPESIVNKFVINGTNSSLLVDGSVTPVVFTYPADAIHDISLQEIQFVIASNSVTFGGGYFGGTGGPLANGVLVEIVSNGNTGTVAIMKQNECFVHFASPGGFQWVVSSKDMLASTYVIGGGLKLKAGTSDMVRITIRDDIDAAAVYFKCQVKGNLLQE